MIRTFRISLSLKNTYRVNSILYSIKQLPIIKKILPDNIYRVHALKIIANIISVIIEIITAFLGKFIYFAALLYAPYAIWGFDPMHMIIPLTLIGAVMNNFLLSPDQDKQYAIISLNIDAKKYSLANYFYRTLKLILFFFVFSVLLSFATNAPLRQYLLIPLFAAAAKMCYAALSLRRFDKKGTINGKHDTVPTLLFYGIMLIAAYGLPTAEIFFPYRFTLPGNIASAMMGIVIFAGILAFFKIIGFNKYRELFRHILIENTIDNDQAKLLTEQNRKSISADSAISSNKKGFSFLNELFIKRHKKILWSSSLKISAFFVIAIIAAIAALYYIPDMKESINSAPLKSLPWFTFVMFAVNRGQQFTTALFTNCDHSLLTYSFYKKPKYILKLFRIRLREIIKINALPALIIGVGLSLLLYLSGGTDNPLNYIVIVTAILAMSIFFSTHSLTVYYLLQPYNIGTEIVSGGYKLVTTLTYIACYILLQIELPTLYYGITFTAFCIIYFIAANILIYFLAPKTFRIRV